MTKTGAGLVEWGRSCVHDGKHVYCYGTYCNLFTASKYAEKKRQYPAHYTDDRVAKYQAYVKSGKIATDCIGLIKGYLWQDENGKIKYANGSPDVSAKEAYKRCTTKGKIADGIPNIPGVLVFNAALTHVGVYDGEGNVLEAQSFAKGLRENKLTSRTFTLWGLYPEIDYNANTSGETEVPTAPTKNNVKVVETVPTIRKGDEGVAVKIMQKLLIVKGFRLPKYGADGDYGSETMSAVIQFQTANSLTADGICGPNTWAALAK